MSIYQTTDHLGNVFNSDVEMCEKYGISTAMLYKRRKQGWPLEKILTTPRVRERTDHLGNKFGSKNKMCEHYEISVSQFNDREALGWPLEKILTTPIRRNKWLDHKGKIFKTKNDLLNFYEIAESTFDRREALGWPLEKILTTPIEKLFTDPITFKDLTCKELCNKYHISKSQFWCRIYKYSIIATLDISICINSRLINISQTKYNLTVSKRIQKGKDVFECYIDNRDGTSTFKIMSYDMIDQYCIEQYKKLHSIE